MLPPIVTGPVIIVIGLRLSSSAINNAFYVNGEFNLKALFVTVCVLATVIAISIFAKGIFNLMPILFAIIVGFIVSCAMGFCDFTTVREAHFFSFMDKSIRDQLLCAPVFRADAILAIAPIALVTMVEHVGDITTNSAVTGQNFMVDPGVHRTLLGDGLATALADRPIRPMVRTPASLQLQRTMTHPSSVLQQSLRSCSVFSERSEQSSRASRARSSAVFPSYCTE